MVLGGDACGVICLGAALRESEQFQTPQSKRRKHLTFGALLEVEMSKKCTPLCREARSQNYAQNTPTSEHLWKLRCRKVDAAVARSTFPSQNVQSTPTSEHFWKLRCRKSARRCGAKRISKSKCAKHQMLGSLLKVQMWFSAWQAQGILHLAKSEQNVRVL